MSFYVYVSHRDPVEALIMAKEIMTNGDYPFVPSLNKLVSGKTDTQWENYFKMWLLRCDVMFMTSTGRPHEKMWAQENKVPIVHSMRELSEIKLPPFGELGRRFGEELASHLPKDERWRHSQKEETVKEFHDIVGLGHDPVLIGTLALKAWDRTKNG